MQRFIRIPLADETKGNALAIGVWIDVDQIVAIREHAVSPDACVLHVAGSEQTFTVAAGAESLLKSLGDDEDDEDA